MSQQVPDRRALLVRALLRHPNLDPRAVTAVAGREGLGGGIGDQGTSFGPFQLHQGGAYPAAAPQNPQAAQQWAWSPQGLEYALSGIEKVAGGLRGRSAISNIVKRFERPANPGAEIAGAVSSYGGQVDQTAGKLETLRQTYGNWTNALGALSQSNIMPQPEEPAHQLAINLFNAAAPNARSVALLQNLGGIASKAARSAMEEIPLASKLIGQLPASGGPIDVRMDHKDLISPNVVPVIQAAEKFLGTPYLWGGADPRKGFDCSGFVQYLYRQEGIDLPRTTYEQVKKGTPIHNPKQLQPGDIVFFSKGGDVHHEGLYIGHGQFIHAPHTGDHVRISSLSEPYYQQQFLMGRRVLNQGGGQAL